MKKTMTKRTYYYCLGYLQQNNQDAIFRHLPVITEVTTDKAVAEKWFQDVVYILENHYRRKLIRIEETELDYGGWIKAATFECSEAGYAKGEYCVKLECYSHHPYNFDL